MKALITDEGTIDDFSSPGARASVYAIYDESQSIQYVGVTRAINASLRLHLGRKPEATYFVKTYHMERPNRSLLDAIKAAWVESSGGNVPGTDDGPEQKLWEGALECFPLMTAEEREAIESAPVGDGAALC